MELNLTPVKVDITIETPTVTNNSFYNVCFITENNEAPRTVEINSLADLLANGYKTTDAVYNFCFYVFLQNGMSKVYVRNKRSDETYEQAFDADDNSNYYYCVIESKDISKILSFNDHLNATDKYKLQFFSSKEDVSDVIKGSKIVFYYDGKLSNDIDTALKPSYISMKTTETLQDFDYAVLRYIWSDNSGFDLDTRTQLQIQGRDNLVLGWNRYSEDADYLEWAGDNTASGQESVLVNMSKLSSDFGGQIKIEFAGFWYGERKSGQVVLEFTTYKGGSMTTEAYSWVNQGGTVVQNLSLTCNVVLSNNTQDRDSDGQKLAVLNYDVLSKQGQLTKL